VNDFQHLMRQWTVLAPYNAGHIMRVSGAPDLERWRAALSLVLRTVGITEPIPLQLSALESDQKIVEELNRPFVPGTLPLRAFVIVDRQDSHLLGVIYDHWFADSPSLRAFMQRAFVHYSGSGENLPPLRLAGEDDETLEHSRFIPQLRAVVACIRNYLRHRRAHRVHLRDPLDFGTGFFSTRFPDGAIDRIRAFAKKHGATVNDTFLAASSQALGKFAAAERSSNRLRRTKRDRIAIATAVDLKPLSARKLDDVFGFFVGYFTVVHDDPESRSLAELVAATARETSVSKSATHALQFAWSLRVARWIWDRSSRARFKAQLFQKGLPLLAGISNVNLTGSWADQEAVAPGNRAAVLDYFRVSPVGPLLPLVFTLTTIRCRLSLCVTYRTTAFSQKQAERIATELMERLQRPE
jgi:NRPS condensation-like uncharacterized protein